MVVYLDVVFIENFIIDFIVLEVTSFFLKSKVKMSRFLLGSLFGGIISTLYLMFGVGFLVSFIFKILLSFLIVFIVFGMESFIKKVTYFYLTTLVFAGMCFAVVLFNRNSFSFFNGGIFIDNVSFTKVLCGIVFGILFTKLVLHFWNSYIERNNLICELSICLFDKKFRIKSLVDSGNFLKEKTTGRPVVIVEKGVISASLGVNFLEKVDVGNFFIIPYSSLGNKNGVLIGFLCNGVNGIYNGKDFCFDAVIGVYNGHFSRFYNGIVGLDVLKNI